MFHRPVFQRFGQTFTKNTHARIVQAATPWNSKMLVFQYLEIKRMSIHESPKDFSNLVFFLKKRILFLFVCFCVMPLLLLFSFLLPSFLCTWTSFSFSFWKLNFIIPTWILSSSIIQNINQVRTHQNTSLPKKKIFQPNFTIVAFRKKPIVIFHFQNFPPPTHQSQNIEEESQFSICYSFLENFSKFWPFYD